VADPYIRDLEALAEVPLETEPAFIYQLEEFGA
jgi:hypothetical protein